MKVIGITGGVGAGKSAILKYLKEKHGAMVIEADKVGHLLMEPGGACYYSIVEKFGSSILNGDQTINRSKLGKIVFADESLLSELNKIIHPRVKSHIVSEILEMSPGREAACRAVFGTWGFFPTDARKNCPSC